MDWINPVTQRASCPECGGFGYVDDGTDDGQDCGTCPGGGVASAQAAAAYLARIGLCACRSRD